MNRFVIGLIVLVWVGSAVAVPSKLAKSSPCTLKEVEGFDKDKSFKIELKNDDIRAVFRCEGGDYFGKLGIHVTPEITNLTGKPMHVAYNIAFFDKKGRLIACTSANLDVKPDAKDDYSFGWIPSVIPKEELGRIVSYQAVLYMREGEKEPQWSIGD